MKKKNRKKIAVALAVTIMATASVTVARAGFVDSWISQTSGTTPGYFEGSQRGYINGGSFSARWPQSTDNLLNISKPSLKSGCGGIDMFLGGMNFLNVDMLVAKLQRILSAAPAAAFDIALKTLAPQVADTIKSFEAIVNKLNNLQMDDCKSAKALVATVSSPFSGVMNDSMAAEMNSAKTDFMQSSGANQLWSSIQTTWKAESKNGGATPEQKAAANASLAGCPAELKAIFGGGSVLEALGAAKGIGSDHIATFRGYIGDAYVFTSAETGGDPIATYFPPCGLSDFEGMIKGTSQTMSDTGNCEDSTDAKRNLVAYVAGEMTTIATAIKNKTEIDAQQVNFMKSIPLPIWPALRSGVQTGTETMIISKLSGIAAKGLAFMMTVDMANMIRQTNDYAKHVKSTKRNAEGGVAPESCQIALLEDPFVKLTQVENNSMAKANEAYQHFTAAASDAMAVESLIASLDKFNKIAISEISQRFSSGVATRISGS